MVMKIEERQLRERVLRLEAMLRLAVRRLDNSRHPAQDRDPFVYKMLDVLEEKDQNDTTNRTRPVPRSEPPQKGGAHDFEDESSARAGSD